MEMPSIRAEMLLERLMPALERFLTPFAPNAKIDPLMQALEVGIFLRLDPVAEGLAESVFCGKRVIEGKCRKIKRGWQGVFTFRHIYPKK
jgi:hypothetical protein